MKVLVFVSAPAMLALPHVEELLRVHAGQELTFVVRDRDGRELGPLLRGHAVLGDKPAGGKLGFVRELRHRRADLALALWLGHDDYWPAKTLFLLAGAAQQLVISERGTLPFALMRPRTWLDHLQWRRRHRIPGVYGRSLVAAALQALYRQTLGRGLGAVLTALRYGLRA